MKLTEFFDLSHTIADKYLADFTCPWEALNGLKAFITDCGLTLNLKDFKLLSPFVWVHKSAEVSPTAYIGSPCIIGAGSEIRHGAYIRGSAIVGENCVIGNSAEVKNSILFDGVQIPHFNYVGDSIFGYKAHLGAGAIISNVKADKSPVKVRHKEGTIDTGLKKFGAIIGDFAEIGCNCVLCPGTVIGKNATVYPLSLVRGFVPENGILKDGGKIIIKH